MSLTDVVAAAAAAAAVVDVGVDAVVNCGRQQVGTGFHGTLAGNVYCSSARVLDDIRALKGMQPAVEAEGDDQEEAGQGDAGRSTSQARKEEKKKVVRVRPWSHLLCPGSSGNK